MIMLRSTHEKIVERLEKHNVFWIKRARDAAEGARGAQKGLLRLQRRYKKLKSILSVCEEDNNALRELLHYEPIQKPHAPLDK